MARGRKKQKNLTLEEQLEVLTKEITEYEEHLKELKNKRKELNKQIEEKQKEEIYRAVMRSGRNIEEVLAALSADNKEENE